MPLEKKARCFPSGDQKGISPRLGLVEALGLAPRELAQPQGSCAGLSVPCLENDAASVGRQRERVAEDRPR